MKIENEESQAIRWQREDRRFGNCLFLEVETWWNGAELWSDLDGWDDSWWWSWQMGTFGTETVFVSDVGDWFWKNLFEFLQNRTLITKLTCVNNAIRSGVWVAALHDLSFNIGSRVLQVTLFVGSDSVGCFVAAWKMSVKINDSIKLLKCHLTNLTWRRMSYPLGSSRKLVSK